MRLSFVVSTTFHKGDSDSIGSAGQRTRFAKTNFIVMLSSCYLLHYLSISRMLKTLGLGLVLKKYLVRSPHADGLSGSFTQSQRMSATAVHHLSNHGHFFPYPSRLITRIHNKISNWRMGIFSSRSSTVNVSK